MLIKKFILYKTALESYKNIISQNSIFEIKFNSIISDDEVALINVIEEVFPNTLRFICYFHYKKILQKNYINRFFKKNTIQSAETLKFINLLGLLP